jgi:hypothetical protein
MRFKSAIVVGLVLLAGLTARLDAAPFINLDFEQATVPPNVLLSENFSAAAAFPGWTTRIGNVALSTVYYNSAGIGGPFIALYDYPLGIGGFPVLEGRYSPALHGLVPDGTEASLSQIGDIPADARSLRLLSPPDRPPLIKINGELLSLVLLSNPGPTLPLWGADITAFAGSTVELRISTAHSVDEVGRGLFSGADALIFSSIPIPEPSSAALVALIMWIIGAWCHRAKRARA